MPSRKPRRGSRLSAAIMTRATALHDARPATAEAESEADRASALAQTEAALECGRHLRLVRGSDGVLGAPRCGGWPRRSESQRPLLPDATDSRDTSRDGGDTKRRRLAFPRSIPTGSGAFSVNPSPALGDRGLCGGRRRSDRTRDPTAESGAAGRQSPRGGALAPDCRAACVPTARPARSSSSHGQVGRRVVTLERYLRRRSRSAAGWMSSMTHAMASRRLPRLNSTLDVGDSFFASSSTSRPAVRRTGRGSTPRVDR